MIRRGAQVAALCWAGLALGGCAATEKLLPSSSGGSGGSVFGNLLAFHTTDPAAAPAAAKADVQPNLQCPTVEVLDGTASYRSYAGADQTNDNVRYQFSMGDIARDCTKSGKDLLLKVGVAGRVLLGPAGSPGSFTVPVRIAVRHDSDGKAVASKFYDVPATIGAGGDTTEFQVVSDPIAVPFVTSNADDDYTILVGFDANAKIPPAPGAKAARAKGRKKAASSAQPQG